MKRKVIYVTIYEIIAIAICSFGFAALSERSMEQATILSILASAIAVLWNFLFTFLFEAWEARQEQRGRSFRRRVAHAMTFEAGLLVLLVPVIAWWLQVTLVKALLMDLVLAAFFLVYTFIFNWVFDRIFGLPTSAGGVAAPKKAVL